MKIAIMTLPLHSNYGGILQAYALQQALIGMGHDPYKIRIDRGWAYNSMRSAVRTLKRHKVLPGKGWHLYTEKELAYMRRNTDRFIRENIRYTPKVSVQGLKRLKYDAFIVGSDQVWRSAKGHYYLDFVPEDSNARVIAYGASFGVDEWPFGVEDTERLRRHLGKFDAVSVREDSGVALCRDHLYADAVHVLDPTMLPGIQLYEDLIEKSGTERKRGILTSYILDMTEGKNAIQEELSARLGLTLNPVMPEVPVPGRGSDLGKSVFPPVEEWLAGFADADFVVTDSFHGMVFAILFNKPFAAICNEARGAARFGSLLRMSGLGDRLISEGQPVPGRLISPVMDFSEANRRLEEQRKASLDFLRAALSGERC